MIEPIVFDATTPRHAMPFLIPGQAQKEMFVNESLALIDMLLHPVVTGSATAPPTSSRSPSSRRSRPTRSARAVLTRRRRS